MEQKDRRIVPALRKAVPCVAKLEEWLLAFHRDNMEHGG
jgi:hypothetical protein